MQVLTQLFAVLLLAAFLSSPAFAKKDDKTLSMSVFTRLNSIEKLMNQQDYEKAQKKLTGLLKKLPDAPTDRAYILYTQATLFLYQEKYKQAYEYYQKSYELNSLNEKTTSTVAQVLGNLSLHFEDYPQAVHYLNEHIQLKAGPADKQVLLALATAYFQLEEFASVESPLGEIVQRFAPDKNIYLLLFSAYYEQNKLNSAAATLENIIRHWPEEPDYWLQLASIYLEQKKITKSLEVLQLAFTKNLLLKENELLQYVYALYEKGLPNKAAHILAQAADSGLVKNNYKNSSLLASLYVDAREDELALKAFKVAAGFAKDGKEDLYISQIYFDKELWKESIDYARKALDKGIKNAGNAHMMIAASYHELEQSDRTRMHLAQAIKYKKTREMASQWIANLD